jgi:hypothetical protein
MTELQTTELQTTELQTTELQTTELQTTELQTTEFQYWLDWLAMVHDIEHWISSAVEVCIYGSAGAVFSSQQNDRNL